ncbi:MAG: DUF3037 domain-containing protein [Taibaiella sp.]|nr:DUF3037 domain-containing protein [Taibaiella sp.]
MQGQQLFEYAVIRMVPRVEREEFLNIGVVLYCRGTRFLGVRYDTGMPRLKALATADEIAEVTTYMQSLQLICEGAKDSGPIGKLPVAERFRWLTATRSTVVQASKVHPGLCSDPTAMLEKLFAEMVL